MSPLEIQVILQINARGSLEAELEVFEVVKDDLLEQGVIEYRLTWADYKLTDRGQAYVDFLLAMPLPTELKSWHMPTYDEWEGIETLREGE